MSPKRASENLKTRMKLVRLYNIHQVTNALSNVF